MTTSTVPPEVLQLILFYLHQSDSHYWIDRPLSRYDEAVDTWYIGKDASFTPYSDWASLSLVCRSWHAAVTSVLYRRIALSNLESIRLFSETITIHNKTLAHHVKELELTDTRVTTEEMSSDLTRPLLSALTTLWRFDADPSVADVLLHIDSGNCPMLTHLALHGSFSKLPDFGIFVDKFRMLTSLALNGFDSYRYQRPSSQILPFRQLESLHFENMYLQPTLSEYFISPNMKLRRLSLVDLGDFEEQERYLDLLERLLRNVGEHLETLHVVSSYENPKLTEKALALVPNLEELSFTNEEASSPSCDIVSKLPKGLTNLMLEIDMPPDQDFILHLLRAFQNPQFLPDLRYLPRLYRHWPHPQTMTHEAYYEKELALNVLRKRNLPHNMDGWFWSACIWAEEKARTE